MVENEFQQRQFASLYFKLNNDSVIGGEGNLQFNTE